jgi:hypothetical protein
MKWSLILLLSFVGCAVTQVAPPVKDAKVKYVNKKSSTAHPLALVVKDERKNNAFTKGVTSYLYEVYKKQLIKLGHKVESSSDNQLILYVKDYSIELSGSVCTTKANFRYSYNYGKRMTANHYIEDSETSTPCFSNEKKYESTEILMGKMLADFVEWFAKNNQLIQSL